MMVSAAAHSSDILGAGAAGLRNATVGRPDEFGPGTAVTVPKESVDIVAKDLNDLADRLGSS
jgi:2-haloacid dehalogenase